MSSSRKGTASQRQPSLWAEQEGCTGERIRIFVIRVMEIQRKKSKVER
jgi:hypothetical protein